MPEGEEIDAVTGAAVEKPTPELEDQELKELDELVEQQKDHELNFWMKLNGYTPEKLEKLFEIGARKRPNIRVLCTQYGKIGTAGFLKIAHYLPKFQNLHAIYLDRCPIGDDGIAALCPAVQATKIERLWLGGCDIGDAGAQMLAESMPKWPEFLYLQLSGNPIGDVGACALFKHVYTGPLQQLYMHNTNLTVVSAAALLDAQLECQPRDDGPRALDRSDSNMLLVLDSRDQKSIIISLDPQAISKTSWRTHGWIPNKELFAEARFIEGSWDYGPIQRKMWELQKKKVPLKTSEEKCCVLQ